MALLYVAALVALFATQRRFIYPAPRVANPPVGSTRLREATLETSDGLTLRALHRPADEGRRTVVFFHGNGDSLAGALAATEPLATAGYGLTRDAYANAAKLPRMAAPVLVLHGATDTLIPSAQGERLARAARNARLELVAGAGHELVYLPASSRTIARWLKALEAHGAPSRP